LVYAAIANANLDFSPELAKKSYPLLTSGRPEVIVLAPVDYWETFHKYDAEWVNKVAPNLRRVANELSTEIQFFRAQYWSSHIWGDGKLPILEGNVVTTPIFKSNISNEI
jgi:hypothetical protein